MSSSFKHIVRMVGRDLDGTRKVIPAIAELRGVGVSLASALVNALRLDPKSRMGNLTDQQISTLEESIRNPSKYAIPNWFLNRRRDPETGMDHHVVGADLDLSVKTDIGVERHLASWRGVRHSLGLKVRGQRTRTAGRKGRAMGVRKVAVAPGAVAAASTGVSSSSSTSTSSSTSSSSSSGSSSSSSSSSGES